MNILVVSSSLNPSSRSRLLARNAVSKLQANENNVVTFLDLQDRTLPFCDGGSVYELPEVVATKESVEQANAIIFATPIYVYGVNAALKNFAELFGHSMKEKLAGFLCAAGGSMSYMSVMGFANSLMLDFRMIVLPRFVYVSGEGWDGDRLTDDFEGRLDLFAREFSELGGKLQS